MRRRPALEVEAAVGILRIDAVAERVALEVRKRGVEAKGRYGLDEVRPVERADDRPAEDVVFRVVCCFRKARKKRNLRRPLPGRSSPRALSLPRMMTMLFPITLP